MATLKWEMGLPKANDDVATPEWLMKDLRKEFGEELFDPCPLKSEKKDGLEIEWGQVTYVNPPYSNIRPWLEKAIDEMGKGKTILFLIPFKPQSAYYQDLILPYCQEIRCYSKDIIFQGYTKPTPFSMCLVVFKGEDGRRKRKPVVSHDSGAQPKKRKRGHTWQYYTLK